MSAAVASDSGGGSNRSALAFLTQSGGPRLRKAVSAYLIGVAMYETGKSLWKRIEAQAEHTVTIDSRDDLYPDVMAWLYESIPEAERKTLRATTTDVGRSDSMVTSDEPSERTETRTRLRLHYAGTKSQTVMMDGHRIKVEVEQERNPGRDNDGSYHLQIDKVSFTARDVHGREAVLKFLRDAAESRVVSGPRLYIGNRWGGWNRMGDAPQRDFKTVALADGVEEDITEDLTQFLTHEHEYINLGLPWHRGYLFYGPPGTGKTTLAKALASRFGMDVYFIPLADLDSDTNLLELVNNIKPRSMLLLEEMDINEAASERTDSGKGASMSALLQALDGIVTPHGLISVMITNHIEKLDEAVIRSGRIDRRFEIDYLTTKQLIELVYALTGEHIDKPLPDPLGFDISPADVVEVLKHHIGQPQNAVDAVVALIHDRMVQ